MKQGAIGEIMFGIRPDTENTQTAGGFDIIDVFSNGKYPVSVIVMFANVR